MIDFSQHIQRIDQAHQRLDKHDSRLITLETHTAVATERAKNIEKSLDDIKGGQTWLIRLVIGAILLGVVAFILKGGLNVS